VSALPAREQPSPGGHAEAEWAQIDAAAPRVAAVMRRYLRQLGTFLAPRSVDAADCALRQLARWMITEAHLAAVGDIRRDDIEDYKAWLAAQPRGGGQTITAETHRQRMRTVRQFFERIIEWDWPGAPPRNPVIAWDIPKKPEPLPKFLDDRDAAKLMGAARTSTDPRDRLVAELLARTGMRAGELADLDADAVVRIGAGHWLRIPLGKLRNDRYVPLHPELVDLLAAWTAANLEHIRRHKRLVADHRGVLDRHLICPIVRRVARAAGVPGVHPHRLRHTLATQAINRGMRLEAIAALLGHQKMEMTLIYAKIANRVVLTSTPRSAPRSTPSTASRPRCLPATRPPAWPGCAAKPTPGCSATACAPDPPSWTAAWSPPARPAPTSAPAPSSCPSWSASATTPATTARPTGRNCSPPSSSASKDSLDNDHPYNAD
jgi:site-specific recombinase XerD